MEDKTEEMEFKVKWCGLCRGNMIICPKCGNNGCNGGSGIMDKDGNALEWNDTETESFPCDVCSLAYQYQKLYWEMEKICTCGTECNCKWGRREDAKGIEELFVELLEHNPKCPIHNELPPNKDCPIHNGDED